MSASSTLLQQGHIVTMDASNRHFVGDLRITGDQISALGERLTVLPNERVVDARDTFVVPGLIQTHTHLCQTLFRGLADDLELLDWLKQRIWPFEAAHTKNSLRIAARFGLMEMQKLGTTSILDMGTNRSHDVIFEEALSSGMRYWGGPCFMDKKDSSGPLYRDMKSSLAEFNDLYGHWVDKSELVRIVVSPRFVISCSERMLIELSALSLEHKLLFHTHASESKTEIGIVKKRTGLDNVKYLKKLGALHERTVLAHGVHFTRSEAKDMVTHRCGLAHCPSSNLKLASGLAPITEYLELGMKVGIGADGAPCNNIMDPFMEMRLAALLQKPKFGPTALPAKQALELATIRGAEVLNAQSEIGSLEVGKKADITVVSRKHPSVGTVADPYSAIVYSCSGRDVLHVWINGKPVISGGVNDRIDESETLAHAKLESRRFLI